MSQRNINENYDVNCKDIRCKNLNGKNTVARSINRRFEMLTPYKDLIQRAQDDDEKALEEIIERVSYQLELDLRQSILKHLNNMELKPNHILQQMLKPLVNETWARAWANRKKFVYVDDEKAYHWLRVIGANVVGQWARKYRKRIQQERQFSDLEDMLNKSDSFADDGLDRFLYLHSSHNTNSDVEYQAELKMKMDEIVKIVRNKNLNPTHVEILLRRIIAGEEKAFLADEYGINESTVSQICYRISKSLRGFLDD